MLEVIESYYLFRNMKLSIAAVLNTTTFRSSLRSCFAKKRSVGGIPGKWDPGS